MNVKYIVSGGNGEYLKIHLCMVIKDKTLERISKFGITAFFTFLFLLILGIALGIMFINSSKTVDYEKSESEKVRISN